MKESLLCRDVERSAIKICLRKLGQGINKGGCLQVYMDLGMREVRRDNLIFELT